MSKMSQEEIDEYLERADDLYELLEQKNQDSRLIAKLALDLWDQRMKMEKVIR